MRARDENDSTNYKINKTNKHPRFVSESDITAMHYDLPTVCILNEYIGNMNIMYTAFSYN